MLQRLTDLLLIAVSILLLLLGTMLTMIALGVVAVLGMWFFGQSLWSPDSAYADVILPLLRG